ncbi:hypothetical protein DCC39_08675 [Pueribacillus theae]|uniref:DUF4179 domain-containing protein n=1 Tax=Pueribacillus theae TaxID=2171751 RepID=A0A2U1K3V0_9BACI|nr:DUF4179 domain-containing protein [Pueribacillus theae]PWA11854.1 hypothetical protein DCC39_08675 [Pueribacillus theae]
MQNKGIMSATIAIAIGILMLYYNQDIKIISARDIPATSSVEINDLSNGSSIFEKSGDKELIIAEKKRLITKVEQSATDQDITFTIHDVYYNDNQIFLAYSIQSKTDHLLEGPYPFGGDSILINGKRLNSGGKRWFTKVSNDKYVGVYDINPITDLPDQFRLEMVFPRIFNQEGNWSFDFNVKETVGNKIPVFDKSKSYKESTLALKSMKLNPAGTAVSFDLTQNINESELDSFNLLTDDGKALNVLDFAGFSLPEDIKGNKETIHYVSRFSEVKENTHI